ncbi:MAG TPA: sigma-70 family RNA polymerase sigma factor [Cyclobacteriaceae bacterium]
MMTLEVPVLINTVAEREEFFIKLYKQVFPGVAEFISKRNGTLTDAKDIFQDALVIFYEKMLDGKLEGISQEAYLFGITKHLWLRKFKHDKKNISLSDFESAITIPEDYFPEVRSNVLLKFLEQTGKKCMELLTAFYYHKQSMQKITRGFGYTSERSTTVQKYKCMEKIRDKITEKSLHYEDFIE